MFRSDDKIVSITFNNKDFLNDVSTTIKALENLNDATSSRNLKTTGLDNLTSAFGDLNKSATKNIESINNAVSDTSAYGKLSDSVGETSRSFSLLEGIAVGAMISIGNSAMNIAYRGISTLTSGIRSGWQEYNLLIDSTQTILANTEKYGTTIDDVTASLDVLNEYADKTIYNFAQMTRNMGYFTTSGMNLDTAQNMVQGMSNVAALFGATNESLQRAMYQTSQAISAGMFRKMDWKSLQNATMSGEILQDELIRVAALMSGRSFDDMKAWVKSVGGFYESLDKGWLTSEIFEETMRRFAGMTREEVAAIRDINGNALDDAEIDRIVKLGESGLEAAQKVRTLHQMLEAVGESIGSGWAQTFRLIIGDLEAAKEFWSPINDTLTSVIGGIGDYRNSIVGAWAAVYRSLAVRDIAYSMESLKELLEAIGRGFSNAFGSVHQIANRIGQVTEAIGDLTYAFRLDEDELQDVTDLVQGLASPLTILFDIIYDVVRIVFNASDAMNEFDERGTSLVETLKPIRKSILDILGTFGRFLTLITNIIRGSGIIHRTIVSIFGILKIATNVVRNTVNTIMNIINNIWTQNDMTAKVIGFVNIVYTELIKLKAAVIEVGGILKVFFSDFISGLSSLDLDPINDVIILFTSLKQLIDNLLNPTISLTEAFNTFKDQLKLTSAYRLIVYIKNAIKDLSDTIRSSSFGPYIDIISNALSRLVTIAKYTIGAIIVGLLKIKELISGGGLLQYISSIGDGFLVVFNKLRNTRFGEFISEITNNISTSLNNLSLIFKGNKVTSDAIVFVDNIKDALTIKGGLPENNVITFVKGLGQEIKDTADMVSNSKAFTPLKNAISEIRDVSVKSFELIDIFNDKNDTYSITDKSTKVFSNVVNIFKDIGSSIGNVGSSVYNSVKSGFQTFSDTLSLMASGERYQDLDNAQRFADIVNLFIRVFTRIASSVLLFLSVLSQLRWASALKSIGKTFENKFKAEKWDAISKIFIAIAVISVTLTAGVALISKFVNIDKYTYILGAISRALINVVIALSVMMGVIFIFGSFLSENNTTLMKKGKLITLQTDRTIKNISNLVKNISKLITKITVFIAVIAVISIFVSKLDSGEYDQFKDAMNILLGIFIAISTVFTILTAAMLAISKKISPLQSVTTALSGPGNNNPVDPIMQVLKILKTITRAIVFVMLGMAASVSMILLSAKDIDSLETALKWFVAIISIMMLAMVVVIDKIDLMSKTMNIAGAETSAIVIGRVAQLFKSIAVSLLLGSLAIAVSLATMTFAAKVIGDVLEKTTNKGWLIAILAGLAAFLLMLVYLMGKLTVTIAMLPPDIYANIGGKIAAIAASMVIMSSAFAILVGSLLAFTVITSRFSYGRLLVSFGILIGVFAIVEGTLIAIAKFSNKFPHLENFTLVKIAGAMTLAASSLLIIASALMSVALIPANKLTQVAITLGALFVAISAAIGVLAAIFRTPGGVEVLLAAGGAMVLAAGSMYILSAAMLKASEAFTIFTLALQAFQKLNGNKVRDNIIAIAQSLPEFLRIIIANFDMIKLTIVEFGSIFGTAFATSIVEAVQVFNSLIQGNSAMIISGIGSVLIGLIYGILLVVKEFIETLVKPGSVLWDIMSLLGQFLTESAEYAGYYGFLIVVEFFKGVINAITDLGWDLYIETALNRILTSVKNWWADNAVGWIESQINNLVTAVNVASNLDDIEAVQNNLNGINSQIEELESHGFRNRNINTGGYYNIPENDPDAQANYDQLLREREQYQNQLDELLHQNNDIWAIYDGVNAQIDQEQQDLMDANNAMEAMIDNAIDAERRARHIFDNAPDRQEQVTGYSTYMPDQYRGLALDDRAETATSRIANGISNIGNAVRGVLGITEGQSVSEFLFGGLTSSLGINDAFSSFGSDSGSGFLNGFTNAINSGMDSQSIDLTDLSIDEPDYDLGKYSSAVTEASYIPEELKDPVISPVWDDTELKYGVQNTLDWWKTGVYDEFAIDASNSMLLREHADGDATSDGSVTYSFTQINNSPKALSAIELYKDTNNLLRGRIAST